MQSTNSSLSLPRLRQDIISESELWITGVSIRFSMNSASAVSGFITNIINIVVFSRMGINHSATAAFHMLSVADLLVGFIGIIAGVINGLRYLGPASIRGSMYALYVLLLSAATIPALMSLVSTAVIALVRCCSVTLPLRVKSLLTARRQRVAILCPTVISLAALTYAMTGTRLEIRPDRETNASQLVILLHPDYVRRSQYADIFRGIMFYLCFFIVNVCLVLLILALLRSSRFRKMTSRAGSERKDPSEQKGATGASSTTNGSASVRRDVQVIKVVILVSAVFTVCNLPAMVASIVRQTVPGLSNVGSLRNTYDLMMMLVEAASLLSGSLNILIYLGFNTRYRNAFLEAFGAKEK